MRTASIGFALACLLALAAPAPAQDHENQPTGVQHEPGHSPSEEHEDTGHGLHHRNFLGLVLGGTYESAEEDTFFTVGLEYERLFNERFAIGFAVEHISDVDALLFVAPFVYRHGTGLRLVAGPGIELKTRRPGSEESEEEAGHGEVHESEGGTLEPGKDENLFLWRFGVGWNIGLSERVVLAPFLNLDLVREEGHWVEAFVFTVALGFDF